ncbi:MAG: phytanoyl-CoA dioxygenase family protein [Verrucomicrobiae bacterium]|nr:phytanoyl-CoA dioxygenase family protein [Verrucomicrobiae bacterium]
MAAGFEVSREKIESWNHEGYMVVRRLFHADEVAELSRHFDAIAASGTPIPRYWEPDLSPEAAGDPLKRYPRVMMPHRWDELSRRWLLDPRVHDVLVAILGEEPIATQSMFYFKPPGARGQAMHQDNFYLQVKPKTCVAAWTAIDPATPENGGLYVVPGTHRMDIVCPEKADEGDSFTTHFVRAPAGMKAVPTLLEPGDTLFFNGSLIHGSGPNRSKTMWRRSFICHYMPEGATNISKFYFPLFNFSGAEVQREASSGGGPCGDQFDTQKFTSDGSRWH